MLIMNLLAVTINDTINGGHEIVCGIRWGKFFGDFTAKKNDYKYLFEQNKCPCFLVEQSFCGQEKKNRVILNAKLSVVEFFRLFDPYQAFQEISMFMGNLAITEDRIPPISNSDL